MAGSRLLNVRLDDRRLRKARRLRERGVSLSDVVREAIDARFEPLERSATLGDVEFRNDVFACLLKYAEHEPEWADGCLAVLCGRDARRTYDREFRTTWRRPDGRAIPLAVRHQD